MRMFVFKSGSLISDHRFDQQQVTIGSAENCTLRLEDPRISPKHACLAPAGSGKWVLQAFESEHSIVVNHATVRGEKELRDLDEIVMGSFTLKVYLGADQRSGSVDAQAGTTPKARRESFAPPPGSIVRPHADTIVLSPRRMREYADAAIELSALGDLPALLDSVLTRAAALQPFGTASVRVFHRSQTGLELSRSADARGRPVEAPTLAALLAEFCTHHLEGVCLPEVQTPGIGSAAAAPLVGSRGAALGSIYIDSPDARAFDSAALDTLSGFAAAIASPIERLTQKASAARAQDADREQLLARQVQDALTLQAMPNWPEVQVAAYRRPGAQSCRDQYDVLRLANKTVAIMVSRIVGGPLLTPRVMSAAHAAFRTSGLHADAPHVFCRTLNWLMSDVRAELSIDMLCAWISPDSDTLKYCLAGEGITAGVLAGGGEWSELTASAAPAIGRVRGHAYASASHQLQAGDVLAIVTAGADTLKSSAGQPFGRTRACESLRDLAGTAINVMLADLVSELDEHATGGVTRDDLTLLLAHRSGT